MMRRLLTSVLLAATFVACAPEPTRPGVITDDQFVAVMLELRRAAREASADEEAFLAERDRILTEHSVTGDDLRAYVAAHSADPERMAEAWRAIDAATPALTVD